MAQEMEPLSSYTYSPLPTPGHIRVLEILPTHERIECRLRNIPHSGGGYYALSYVWGDPATPHQAAIVDEKGTVLGGLPLTQNLANAIRDISNTSIRHRSFWIDQICINQCDLEEKGQQVAMMGKIYEGAEYVVTYAGPVVSEIERQSGLKLYEKLKAVFPPEHDVFQHLKRASSLDISDEELSARWRDQLPEEVRIVKNWDRKKLDQHFVDHGWKWLLEVCLGEWTERLWIVQVRHLSLYR